MHAAVITSIFNLRPMDSAAFHAYSGYIYIHVYVCIQSMGDRSCVLPTSQLERLENKMSSWLPTITEKKYQYEASVPTDPKKIRLRSSGVVPSAVLENTTSLLKQQES